MDQADRVDSWESSRGQAKNFHLSDHGGSSARIREGVDEERKDITSNYNTIQYTGERKKDVGPISMGLNTIDYNTVQRNNEVRESLHLNTMNV